MIFTFFKCTPHKAHLIYAKYSFRRSTHFAPYLKAVERTSERPLACKQVIHQSR